MLANKWVMEQLQIHAEEKFRTFTMRLMPGVESVYGVRLPVLRKMAKAIVKEDWRSYLDAASDESYEEIMLQGMVIGYAPMELSELFARIECFVVKIDNWSVCDSFCAGLKITKEYKAEMFKFLGTYLASQNDYEIRFGIVMLLNYFTEEAYLKKSLAAFDAIENEGYYVRMAVAWAVSIYYIKFPEQVMEYLKENKLDDWTYNKALQKITESRQIDKEVKDDIRSLKRYR